MLPDVVYNVSMLAADVGLLLALRSKRMPALASVAWVCALLLFALAFGPKAFAVDHFGYIRLAAWGGFVHLPAVLVAAAALNVRRGPALGLAALVVAVGVDAFMVEPHWLDVPIYTLPSHKITHPMRIVVLSDIQTRGPDDWTLATLKRAADLHPDLVLMTGDYLQTPGDVYVDGQPAWRDMWSKAGIHPPLGVYAVEGNVDPAGYWPALFDGQGVGTYDVTTNFQAGEATITALAFSESFAPDLHVDATPGFHIVFGHAPDFSLGDVNADLLLAGHTHGGQVQIPFFGPILTYSRVPRDQAAGGEHTLSGDRVLVVSRGVGMERMNAPPLRFWCRPQVVVIDVVPA